MQCLNDYEVFVYLLAWINDECYIDRQTFHGVGIFSSLQVHNKQDIKLDFNFIIMKQLVM